MHSTQAPSTATTMMLMPLTHDEEIQSTIIKPVMIRAVISALVIFFGISSFSINALTISGLISAGLCTFRMIHHATGRLTRVIGTPAAIHCTKGMVIPVWVYSSLSASRLMVLPMGVVIAPIIVATGTAIMKVRPERFLSSGFS